MNVLELFRRPQQRVSEIVGRVTYNVYTLWRTSVSGKTIDETRTDYAFWDKLRRGKLDGYRLGGLFCTPATQIVAGHVWGAGPTLALTDGGVDENDARTYTDTLLARWLSNELGRLVRVLEDLYALGDQFLIVNPDGSLAVANPETVSITRDPLNWTRPVAYTIVTRTDDATVTDEYRLDGRTVTIEWHKAQPTLGVVAGQKQTLKFANLIGRLPVVHWACDRGANEVAGRPIYEAMLRLFSRYDDLLEKALDGAELMGNPIPTFEGLENIQETIDVNATNEDEIYTDLEGNSETRKVIRFDRQAAIFAGKGGRFDFKSPTVGFTEDIRAMLKSLFLLLLDHARIPEYLWGGAISSSKASAETQAPPFAQYIEMRRMQLEGSGADDLLGTDAQGGLLELADVWLRTRALVDQRVVVAPVRAEWPPVMSEDERLVLDKVQYARGVGLLTGETALEKLDLVDDPASELAKAEAEVAEAEAASREFEALLTEAMREASQPQAAARSNGRGAPEVFEESA